MGSSRILALSQSCKDKADEEVIHPRQRNLPCIFLHKCLEFNAKEVSD